MVALFVITSFLTAALLFLVQPMVGRMVLPAFGGSPQVWTTSMLFFQAALLAGYSYTHLTTTRLSRRVQPRLHLGLALVPLALLPITLAVVPSGRGGLMPSLELLGGLVVGVAGPFVLVATSGPLVQRWFSWSDHPRAHDPYFLYAAGNVGSAAGLLAYPFILEPTLSVADQSRVWAGGYTAAVVLLAACALVVARRPAAIPDGDVARPQTSRPVGLGRAGRWVLLTFVPSSLFLAATTHLSTDVAAIPLLWVLPLGTYLLTFSVAFGRFGPAALRAAKVVAAPVVIAALVIRPGTFGVTVAVAVQIVLVAVGGLIAHGLLAADRPEAARLTRFYLWIAVGGALGGVFNGLVAPALFPTALEHGLFAAAALALVVSWRSLAPGDEDTSPIMRLTTAAALAVLAVLPLYLVVTERLPDATWLRAGALLVLLAPLATVLGRSAVVGTTVAVMALVPHATEIIASDLVDRTFFGVHRVERDAGIAYLYHGTTLHGVQDQTTAGLREIPTAYYHPEGPFGDMFTLDAAAGTVGVIGLGAGAIAGYGVEGQRIVYHEIDPAVVTIAEEEFSFLADSDADIEVVLGDGRLTLADVDGDYDLLIADAFTSDAIPVHLLTVEAIEVYLDALAPDGVLVLHVSNRYLDLVPVVHGAAQELGLAMVVLDDDGEMTGGLSSTWTAVARDETTLDPLGWDDPADRRAVLWTDQRSDLWSVLYR